MQLMLDMLRNQQMRNWILRDDEAAVERPLGFVNTLRAEIMRGGRVNCIRLGPPWLKCFLTMIKICRAWTKCLHMNRLVYRSLIQLFTAHIWFLGIILLANYLVNIMTLELCPGILDINCNLKYSMPIWVCFLLPSLTGLLDILNRRHLDNRHSFTS